MSLDSQRIAYRAPWDESHDKASKLAIALGSIINRRATTIFPRKKRFKHPNVKSLGNYSPYGYLPRRLWLHRLWNLLLVVPLILLTSPIMILIALLLLISQGPNIIYRGERVGKEGKSFLMYKFRTLRREAESLTKFQVLPPDTNLETPLGRYLRDCRLDELPQLFNVLAGQMNLVGPRPERPSMVAKDSKKLRGYSVRLMVKPGLVGYTQSIMTHSTPRAIRNRLEVGLSQRDVQYLAQVELLSRTALAVLSSAAKLIAKKTIQKLPFRQRKKIVQAFGLGSRFDVYILLDQQEKFGGHIVRLDHENFIFLSDTTIPDGQYDFLLRRLAMKRRRAYSARCNGSLKMLELSEESRNRLDLDHEDRVAYQVEYRAVSELNHYRIDRYFLHKSLFG